MAAKTTSTKKTTKRSSVAPAGPAPTTQTTQPMPTRDEIKARAFELFVARGREHGRAEEDWLRAETELRERYSVS